MRHIKNTMFNLCLIAVSLTLYGCYNGSEPNESLHRIFFENQTGRSMSLELWNNEGDGETLFCSIDIPAGSYGEKDLLAISYAPIYFTSCFITFDDNRSLKYHRQYGEMVDDVLSPLRRASYTYEQTDNIANFRFTFTDEHYRLAK